jgi:hypothetical protein
MSASASSLINCPTFQAELEANWKNCHTVREPLPILEFLYSPANRQPIVEQVSMGSKIKTVELRYDQRRLESAVSTNQPNPTCSASNKVADKSSTYTIDPNINVQYGESFDIIDLTRICRDNGTFMQQTIQNMIDVLMRKVASVTATQSVALAGAWSADTAVNALSEFEVTTLRSGTTDELSPFAMENVNMALMESGYCDQTVLIGGKTLYQYMRRMQSGCCAQYGNDLSAIWNQYGLATMWDRRVQTAFGSANKTLAIQSGALQIITFNMFDGTPGINFIDDSAYKRMVINDPMTGFPIDMVIKDDCGAISIVLTATHKVVALPLDMFAAGDVFRNVNYVGKIKVNNV